MRIDVTKVKRAIRGNERLILIAKGKIAQGNNGEHVKNELEKLRDDHAHLIRLRTGIDADRVPVEMAECYRQQGVERRRVGARS